MSALGSLASRATRAAGRGAIRASGSRVAMGTIAAGAFGLGFLNKTAPAARDAAFESVLGDKDADIAYTGRKLDSRFLLGNAIGGAAGGAMKYTSPDAFAFNPLLADSNVGVGIGAGLGAAAGGVLGAFGATLAKKGKNAAIGTEAFGKFATKHPGMGKLGRGLGALATNRVGGAALGAAVFGGLAIKGMIGGQYENNRRFVAESPYMPGGNSSMATAQALNASGDIVLGMHNSRRGY